jgi:hypothetical protein
MAMIISRGRAVGHVLKASGISNFSVNILEDMAKLALVCRSDEIVERI